MVVKVFEFNKNHKIEFTREELENLLNEVYNSGYSDGKWSNNSWTWASPYYYGNGFTINASDSTKTVPLSDHITYTTASASSDDPNHVSISVGAYPRMNEHCINNAAN